MGKLLSMGEDLSSEDIYHEAVAGNEKAKMIFHSMGHALGVALANLINIFNFPLYLLSGGALAAWEQFAPAMFTELQLRSFTYRNSRTKIEKATLGNEAGLYGAAYLPLQRRVQRG
jgi:glucokinase